MKENLINRSIILKHAHWDSPNTLNLCFRQYINKLDNDLWGYGFSRRVSGEEYNSAIDHIFLGSNFLFLKRSEERLAIPLPKYYCKDYRSLM